MPAVSSSMIYQAAAIPIRDGRICIITSSSRKRWVVPKGCIEPGMTAGSIALQEAWEEAGLAGVLDPEPVGTYVYEKWGTTCHVTAFVMRVTKIADNWPERYLRQRLWLTPDEILDRINDPGLLEVLQAVFAAGRVEALA